MTSKGTISWGMAGAALGALGLCLGSLEPAQATAGNISDVAKVQKTGTHEIADVRSSVAASIQRARNISRILHQAMVDIAGKPEEYVVEASDFTAVKEQLIEMEDIIDGLTRGASAEVVACLGYDTLRRVTAEARSNAAGAEMLAWQSMKTPDVAETDSNGEGLKALADRFESEQKSRQHTWSV
ncbi:hypothetical protein [Kushneria aurantia]|uniref:Secreted protein n=1 Tax=Kushneria aurantia TaxID=504092 RepID=A0ABV6G6G4_9GAMM|nr:hypothetical protein [Kushneria aurantia]